MVKKIIAVLLVTVFLVGASVVVNAATPIPYKGYEYNSSDESVPAPVGYIPEKVFFGKDISGSDMKVPADMCEYNGTFFILDSGNSRIIVTDKDMRFIREIGEITVDGEALNYTDASGLFVCDNGNILIADTKGCRIIECTNEGKGVKIFEKPDTPMISDLILFSVKKVIRDYNGVTYAVVDGINDGAVTFMQDGSFAGFFASNEVEKTAQVILNYVWRKFMTEEQIRNSKTASPSSVTNFDVAEKGFLYTVTQTSKGESSVRLLNFKGSNLETETKFGDLEWDRKIKNSVSTAFCDVDVDENGYIYLLDSARGRVFVYSEDGYFVTVFGGIGDKTGLMASAVAVETLHGKVYVLDTIRASITVYEENEYTKTLKTAMDLLDKGQYSKSRQYWDEVLKYNSNSTIAYYGIGLALDEEGKYGEALKYFKLSYNNKAYSEAFKEVRRDFIKDNFAVLIFAAIIVIAGIVLLVIFLKNKFGRSNTYERSKLENKFSAPLFTMLHPLDGFERLKKEKKWSKGLCFIILSALFLTLTAKWFLTGFSFNTNRAVDYNVFITLLQSFLIVGVTAVANWAVCTLIEGKGKFIDIISMMVYSLLPFILFEIVYIIASMTFTLEEKAFLVTIEILGISWSAVVMFCGFMSIHEFGFKRTVLSVIMTVIGIAVIIFLAILFVGLLQQVASFFKSIWSEAIMIS